MVVEVTERLRKLRLDYWLSAVACVILVLLIVQAVRRAGAGKLGQELIQASLLHAAPSGRSDVKTLEEYKVISEKGHFGKKKKAAPKQPKLFGILGESALMGTSEKDVKPYAVGAQLPGGAKLVEIHLNSIVLEKDGKRKTVSVFPELGAKTKSPPSEPPKGREKPAERPPDAGVSDEVKPPAVEEETPEEEGKLGAREEEREKLEKKRRAREAAESMRKIRIIGRTGRRESE